MDQCAGNWPLALTKNVLTTFRLFGPGSSYPHSPSHSDTSRVTKRTTFHIANWTGGKSATRISTCGSKLLFKPVRLVHLLLEDLMSNRHYILKNGHSQGKVQNSPASAESRYTPTCTDPAPSPIGQKRPIFQQIQSSSFGKSLIWP